MDKETVAKWFEFDYLPRVGAYRKDCKIGCDACMPKHDGDNYCDIDMLSKVLSILKEKETANVYKCPNCGTWVSAENVIMCKNCKHGRMIRGVVWCLKYVPNELVPLNWFCADGERQEGR